MGVGEEGLLVLRCRSRSLAKASGPSPIDGPVTKQILC